MRKIKYPENIDYKNRILSKHKNIKAINELLVEYNIGKNFDDLILMPINDLIKIPKIGIDEIKKKKPLLNENELKKQKDNIENLFDYKGFQKGELSNFFMNHFPETKTCYYCNLDFINTFIDFKNEYKNKFDIINKFRSIDELKLIDGITDKRADKIVKLKGKIFDENDFKNAKLSEVVKKILNHLFDNDNINFEKIKTHNHFTLDHILPQKDYPHLSLSLYNLVPCCYACNSKFKKEKELHNNINDLIGISPTSKIYDLDILTNFDIFYNENYSSVNLPKDINEYNIKLNSKYEKYIETLKLQGRYNCHKQISFELIEKRQKYSDSQIKEISKLIGKDEQTIKKDLFGKECFESNNEPFEKYKQDIAKQLGLI